VSQRSIEILIGRLITDEAFRDSFVMNRLGVLNRFQDLGYELTRVEIAAVLSVPPQWWRDVATRIDVRLQKADLSKEF
jgi:hypothetical protein